MKDLNKKTVDSVGNYPVTVLQFGEGNFLRAFVDWMIHRLNTSSDEKNGVVVVQPLENGMVDYLNKQDNLYHVILEGIKDGKPVQETELIDCIVDAINPYASFEAYKNYYLSPELKFVISNTTEAGICRSTSVDLNAAPPASFPAKVIALLYDRFQHYKGDESKGLTFICCELIENNASTLQEIVLEIAEEKALGKGFIKWVNSSCSFCNSLVDRIVTGFPKDNIDEVQKMLGYQDNMVVKGEYFHLWAIQEQGDVRAQLPFDKAGLNVLWLDDLKAFRDKKVRVLNGAHTALVPVALLSGCKTVHEAFTNPAIGTFLKQMIAEEVLPNIEGDADALTQFADEILERFLNPYIQHYLEDIALNSLSKWMTRDYPSLLDSLNRTGEVPERLALSLAALMVLYSPNNAIGFTARDVESHLTLINQVWMDEALATEAKVQKILSLSEIWGTDLTALNGLESSVAASVQEILTNGMFGLVEKINAGNGVVL